MSTTLTVRGCELAGKLLAAPVSLNHCGAASMTLGYSGCAVSAANLHHMRPWAVTVSMIKWFHFPHCLQAWPSRARISGRVTVRHSWP